MSSTRIQGEDGLAAPAVRQLGADSTPLSLRHACRSLDLPTTPDKETDKQRERKKEGKEKKRKSEKINREKERKRGK